MQIKAVRVRKLLSGPGYNHHAVEAEAVVGDDEDAAAVREQLTAWVDAELRGHREIDELREHRDSLRSEVRDLENLRDSLRHQVEQSRKIIREHTKLADLAAAQGIKYQGELGDEIPF